MQSNHLNRITTILAFMLGLVCLAWVAIGFVGSSGIALTMTAAIAVAYLAGALEVRRFRAQTYGLLHALSQPAPQLTEAQPSDQPGSTSDQLQPWLQHLPAALQYAVQQRIEGVRTALPGLTLTPYLIGLLVMLGMLGTFLGMVVTFKGAVFALEGSADLAAIRAALAAPIKGLGLAFGTSVAGVATSAMLGLMVAISRRERMLATNQLDAAISSHLRRFSASYQRETAAATLREAAFNTMREQAAALPVVADKLHNLMQAIEERHQQLNTQILQRQDQFHADAKATYEHIGTTVTQLGTSVAQSLETSLVASAQTAASSVQPIVESAMRALAAESQERQRALSDTVQAQLQSVTEQFSAAANTVAHTWAQTLHQQANVNAALVEQQKTSVEDLLSRLEERTKTLMEDTHAAIEKAQTIRAEDDASQRNAWIESLHGAVHALQAHWEAATTANAAQQRTVCDALASTAAQMQAHAHQQANQTSNQIERLLQTSDTLVEQRIATEAAWATRQQEHAEAIAAVWRSELSALRSEETARSAASTERMGQWQNQFTEQLRALYTAQEQQGQAAVNRLGDLQAALSEHLATLGAALEAPLTRLLETSAQAPKAAAEVIAQLRKEMSTIAERDSQRELSALQERTSLVDSIGQLIERVQKATDEQRASIEALVTSARDTLQTIGQQFSDTLSTQSQHSDHTANKLAASAQQLHTLGETFSAGVAHFSASNQQLAEHLERTTTALQNTTTRSDEQLAYYVAQAREVVDLSITAQQTIVQDLRRLRGSAAQPTRSAEGAAA